MLFRFTNISKHLALTAAALLILISVHGIFLHHDSHQKPGEHPSCTLCELHSFCSAIPETWEFIAKVEMPVSSYIYGETGTFFKTPHRLGLRGPPPQAA